MRTYLDPKVTEFGGANRVLVAVIARDGNMFTPEFFAALRKATDESCSWTASTARACSRSSRPTCATPKWSRTASRPAT